MNIRENPNAKVFGVLIEVPKIELPELQRREFGYEMIEVTNKISHEVCGPVYTFLMKEFTTDGKFGSQAYLETCLGGVPEELREQWLSETIIETEIVDDRGAPLCRHYIPLH